MRVVGHAIGAFLIPWVLAAGAALATGQPADSSGAESRDSSPPGRVISLAPSITETVLALGASERLVGVTDFCRLPPDVPGIARLGGLFNPNMELILSLKPDLVIMLPNETIARRLETHKIPTLVVPNDTMEEAICSFLTIGEAIGAEAAAKELADSITRRIQETREKTQGLPRPRVLVVVDKNPLFAAGKGTYLNEIVAAAGGENAVPAGPIKYPQLSMEGIISLAPGVIVDASAVADPSNENVRRAKEYWVRWTSLPAVKSGRVHVLRSDAMIVPGPRLFQALDEMARILHPEVFGAKDVATPNPN